MPLFGLGDIKFDKSPNPVNGPLASLAQSQFTTNTLRYPLNVGAPEAGHYMERSWGAIFYPYPESCIYNAGTLEQIKENIQTIKSYLNTKIL